MHWTNLKKKGKKKNGAGRSPSTAIEVEKTNEVPPGSRAPRRLGEVQKKTILPEKRRKPQGSRFRKNSTPKERIEPRKGKTSQEDFKG